MADHLRRSGVPLPLNLVIFRRGQDAYIYAKWLPEQEADTRPHKGRCKNGKGERLPVVQSLETKDVREALHAAVTWFKKTEKASQQGWADLEQRQHSLHRYWEMWSSRQFLKPQRNVQAEKKFRRDTELKWSGEGYGIKHQPWSLKRVDQITFADFADYFALLEKRARENNGTNGSGIKEQQKTFINHLMREARIDYPHLQIPEYPPITRQTKKPMHLTHRQWDLLLRQIQELSGLAARENLTRQQYEALEWTPNKRQNQRNWVDLYDALLLEWFFYLRSEDMYRLKREWFKDSGDGIYECQLEETKGNREIHKTVSFRPDAYRFMRRLKRRRSGRGYLLFAHIPRPDEGGPENKVRNRLNYLLRSAVQKCLPDFDLGPKPWTTIRHTAFRLTLEDDPSLWLGHKLRDFARNGHTSADQLQTTYITPIQAEQTAAETRDNLRVKGWSAAGRVRV